MDEARMSGRRRGGWLRLALCLLAPLAVTGCQRERVAHEIHYDLPGIGRLRAPRRVPAPTRSVTRVSGATSHHRSTSCGDSRTTTVDLLRSGRSLGAGRLGRPFTVVTPPASPAPSTVPAAPAPASRPPAVTARPRGPTRATPARPEPRRGPSRSGLDRVLDGLEGLGKTFAGFKYTTF